MKLSTRQRLKLIALLPIIIPLLIPGLLKHIFYQLSSLLELIGSIFGTIDCYFGNRLNKLICGSSKTGYERRTLHLRLR